MLLSFGAARPPLLAAAFAALACALVPPATPAAEKAKLAPDELDRAVMAEIKGKSEIMKNLQYLSDQIGGRLTGSKNMERANEWTAEKMKAYGLENVRLEPWEIPVGWQRGKATMKVVEPATGTELIIASAGWVPGTKGKVTGEVVILKAKNKADLEQYKGKLKNAVILQRPPSNVAPITDPGTPIGGEQPAKKDPPKTDEPKKDEAKKPDEQPKKADEPKKVDDPKKADDPKKDEPKKEEGKKGGRPDFQPGFGFDPTEFLKAEGAACIVSDSGKPHGLLVTTGGWPADRAKGEERLPRVYMAHEHYAMLYRLASRENAVTKVEVEIENKFIPGPITVFNTIGEVRGSEKPDEFVVVGAHLDSWELATGTTDNGTGSCIVLESARTIAAMAKAGNGPKRTIRFCLYTGEEQGLWGSKKYVERHKDELPKHSAAIVHDTGTGKVQGFGVLGRDNCKKILDPELESLKGVEGWKGLTMGGLRGGTDHWSYHQAGVPGFACTQDPDEYRLTHHTQSDTFDKAKESNLIQGAQVMSVTAMRIANLPELLPRGK